jgi:MFS family permease
MGGAFYFGLFWGSILTGDLSDKFGRKPVMILQLIKIII